MEITLVDGIKDGHKYELVLVDGKETPMYVASRLLTNTDRERGLGIFNGGNTWFEKGDMRAAFEFEYAKFGTPEYVDVLRKRIAEVRIWVQNLDYEHRISFLVPDP